MAVDVRTASEHEDEGHIPGSLLLPLAVCRRPPPSCRKTDGRSSSTARTACAPAGPFGVSRGGGREPARPEPGPAGVEGEPRPETVAAGGTVLVAGRLHLPRSPRCPDPGTWLWAGAPRAVPRRRRIPGAGHRPRPGAGGAAQRPRPAPPPPGRRGGGGPRERAGRPGRRRVGADPGLQLPPPPPLPIAPAGPAARGVPSLRDFTKEQGERHGRPSKPEHLLEPGELPRLVAPLEVVRAREGEFDGSHVASVAARKT